MLCPYCNHAESRVMDSRESPDERATRRRRECAKCDKRFTTYERVELIDLSITKKDGRRAPFDRNKIKAGIQKACEKRPVSSELIDKTVDEIEARIRLLDKTEVPTSVIGELVMKKLEKLDKVAYIRFASVYREFKDVRSFQEELNRILNK